MPPTPPTAWIQKISCAPERLDNAEQTTVQFAEKTLKEIAVLPNMRGVTWWDSHDISREFDVYQELECDLVLPEKAHNAAYLASRGIKKVIG